VYVHAEAASQFFVSIFDRAHASEPHRYVQQWAVEGAFRPSYSGARVFVGARAQAVYSPSADLDSFASVGIGGEGAPGARAQFAIEPFVGVDLRAVWARIGFLTPLDRPLGFGFDHEGLYTLRFTFGRRL
jgi:hypothetical protein